MAVVALPVMMDLVVYSGVGFHRDLRWLDDDALPKDLTGWTAVLRATPQRGAIAEFELTSATGDLGVGADGVISIDIPAAVTAGFDSSTYVYVLDLIDPDGVVMRFLRGRIVVITDVRSLP